MHLTGENGVQNYKQQIDNYVCSILPDTSYKQVYITPGQRKFPISVNCHMKLSYMLARCFMPQMSRIILAIFNWN